MILSVSIMEKIFIYSYSHIHIIIQSSLTNGVVSIACMCRVQSSPMPVC